MSPTTITLLRIPRRPPLVTQLKNARTCTILDYRLTCIHSCDCISNNISTVACTIDYTTFAVSGKASVL